MDFGSERFLLGVWYERMCCGDGREISGKTHPTILDGGTFEVAGTKRISRGKDMVILLVVIRYL